MHRIAIVLLSVVCACCGGSTPSTPSALPPAPTPSPTPTGLAGTWVGTMVHPDGGTGSLRLTLTLTPQNLYAGTWQSQFANAAYTRAGRALSTSAGPLTATIGISDNDFATSPDRSQPGCLFDHYVILTVGIESNELKGDALFGICANGATLGSVTLRRQ